MLAGLVLYGLVCGAFLLMVQAGYVPKERPWENSYEESSQEGH